MAIVILLLGYWGIGSLGGNGAEFKYVLATAEKGTLVVSVSASGQVSASSQVDIKSKVSGDVVYVGVKSGDTLGTSGLIIQLDSRDTQKAVRDAEANLASAKLSLAKLQKPADSLSLMQAENTLSQAHEDLKEDYDDGFNNVADAFLDLPTVMAGLQDVLYGKTVTSGQDNISAYADLAKNYNGTAVKLKEDTANKYVLARNNYEKIFNVYKNTARSSDPAAIQDLISQSYETVKNIADAVKNASNLLDLTKDELTQRNQNLPSTLAVHQTSLADYISKTNSHLNSLLGSKNSLVADARTVGEKTESLAKIKKGADDLDLASQALAVKQKENALQDVKEKLADYYIRAPFSGTVAKLNVKKLDSVTGGTAVATMVTQQKLAEISLNEVDISKIKIGQKATLTFDAVDGLTLTGVVTELDLVGTISQGVVTYNIKINFEADDTRVKPGMSVTAAIVTDVKSDVLIVPNSSVKNQNGRHYVELPRVPFTGAASAQGVVLAQSPRQANVETGASNDSFTEITSGLNEGDQVIFRTISNAAKTATAPAPSLFGSPGGTRGGNIRTPR